MEQIAENVYVESAYEGVNVGAILTSQGIIAIDAPTYPRQARDWATRLQSLTSRHILYTILTDYHSDRILQTRWLNASLITHQATAEKLASYDKRSPANLSESPAARNPYRSREIVSGTVERATVSFTHSLHLHKGGIHIWLLAAPGPTMGNLWVYLPTKGVLFAGDTVTNGRHPLLLEPTSRQWLASLARLSAWPTASPLIVPGRGQVHADNCIGQISDYLQQMRDRVKTHLAEGKSRESTAVYIPEFLNLFPAYNLPADWLRQQIKNSLDHIYDEIQLESVAK
jgi:glyoxylase-like metal-dependent hydrolase (beta-lactamase superfamily II)